MASVILPTRKNFRDLTKCPIFGRLTVVKYVGLIIPYAKSKGPTAHWICRCSCGKLTKPISTSSLTCKRGVKSCGCRSPDGATAQHGMSFSPEYRAWSSMNQRCTNRKKKNYKNYGGRGISVCDRWKNSFVNFLADIGFRPSPYHSLDRFPDNNGNYKPGNVRWATRKDQARNKRNNRLIKFRGETKTIAEWSELTGIGYRAIQMRINRYKWTPEMALTISSISRKQEYLNGLVSESKNKRSGRSNSR